MRHAMLVCIMLLAAVPRPGELEPGYAAAQEASAGGSGEVVLFPFDDYSIPFNKGLLLSLAAGSKTGGERGFTTAALAHPNKPVLPPAEPGAPDHPRLYYYGTVLHIGGEYRMWYTGMDKDGNRYVCYAVSKDGVRWDRPALGLVQYNGSTSNNLVRLDDGKPVPGAVCLVLHEPEDPRPERRFKMVREVSPSQILAAFSSDGLRWTEFAGNPIIRGSGLEPSGLIKFRGCYYINGHGGPVPHPIHGASKRMMVTFASYDFEHWTRAAHVSFRRDDVPPRLPADLEFHRGEQVHVGASLWNRGNVVLGFYGQYHNPTNDRRTSTCDLGLVVSHDALHFKEPIPDFKIVPSAEETDWAEPRLLQGQGFENVGDRTFFWYSIWVATNPQGPTGVRLATWPRDRLGYFAPAVDVEEPHFISAPIQAPRDGAGVAVNADGLSADSFLRVEVLSEQLVPLQGYSADDALPITESGLRRPAAWRGRESLGKLSQPIRIRVNWGGTRPDKARVYAVYLQ
ncbi:MAG: hypothetical protein DMG07_28285 [Acidobacteria bacterium]|nr:MAG: hypothetical protein DMG07_28285 [Acidobacteriota bacterium]